MTLDKNTVKTLKKQAHGLKPIVQVGQHGVTEAVIRELDLALKHHELVKIRVSGGDRTSRVASVEKLSTETSSEIIQQIGATATLYRRNPKKTSTN